MQIVQNVKEVLCNGFLVLVDAYWYGTCDVYSTRNSVNIFRGKRITPIISGVLQNIPYAILGAMIFPAILLIKEGDILFGLVGTVTAFVIAFAGANVIIVVIGAIAILSIYSFFF